MTTDRERTALVVGAGIGGLAAAIAVRRAGWEVSVLERAERIEPLGAGLSIWPNGVRALRTLGLGALADEAPRGGGALRRADGSVLAEFDPETIAERYGAPLVGLHRAELHEALVAALGPERIELGTEVTAGTGHELTLADGSVRDADLIVGADGIGSAVRRTVIDDGEPHDSGIVAFRGVAEFEGAVAAGEWWGEDAIAGLLPLRDGQVYWYLALRGEPERAELDRRVTGFGRQVGEIVAATAPDSVLAHRLFDRHATSGWSTGRTTVLGDAAHAMLPFLGQGACAALEDAVALGAALRAHDDVTDAIAAYEVGRYARTAALVRDSARAGRIALAESSFGRGARDTLVSRTPERLRLRQLDKTING